MSITNYLIQVDVASDRINPSKSLKTGPNLKSVKCNVLSVCAAVNSSCAELKCVNNDNIITAVSTNLNLAVLCGSARNCHMRDLSDISTAYDDKITEEYRCEFSQQMTAGQQPGVTGMRALSSEFSVEGRDFLMMTIGTRSRVYLMTDKRGGPKKSSLELVETADEYSEGQVDHFLAHHSRNGYTFTVKVLSDGSTEIGRFCEAAADSYYKDLLPSEFKNALKTSYNYLKFKCTGENNEVLSTAVHADFVDEHLVGYFEGSAATVYVCKLSISKINDYINSLRKLCLEGIGSDDVEVIGSGQCSSNLKNFVSFFRQSIVSFCSQY